MNKKPKSETKNHKYLLKLSDKEVEMLSTISFEKDISMAEILRKGLRMMYNLHINS